MELRTLELGVILASCGVDNAAELVSCGDDCLVPRAAPKLGASVEVRTLVQCPRGIRFAPLWLCDWTLAVAAVMGITPPGSNWSHD